jgi:hypothetical protein
MADQISEAWPVAGTKECSDVELCRPPYCDRLLRVTWATALQWVSECAGLDFDGRNGRESVNLGLFTDVDVSLLDSDWREGWSYRMNVVDATAFANCRKCYSQLKGISCIRS